MNNSTRLLPSYQDATCPPDPLLLIAPYVRLKDYTALCRVSKRFYDVFAPRLWHDPLRIARRLGLHPSDDIKWFQRFMSSVSNAQLSTRQLVRILDFRGFASDALLFDTDGRAASLLDSTFGKVGTIFPSLRSVIIDNHPVINPSEIVLWNHSSPSPLFLLSIASASLPADYIDRFAALPSGVIHDISFNVLPSLVFLDISLTDGPLWPFIRAIAAGNMPGLRILKARSRGISGPHGLDLFKVLGTRLWSLDLSGNILPDIVAIWMANMLFVPIPVSCDSRFFVEGRVVTIPEMEGCDEWGGYFEFVEESAWSRTFKHPERFCVDAPPYDFNDRESSPQENVRWRSDALDPVRQDDVDSVQAALTVGRYGVQLEDDLVPTLEIATWHMGLTHLHISGCGVTTYALQRLIRLSPGQLEHIDCDDTEFLSPRFSRVQPTSWRGFARIVGAFDCVDIFRPLLSPNLRSLRVHHSLVTGVPTLDVRYVAFDPLLRMRETELIAQDAGTMYPLRWVPDANPRLESLTLTYIPRRLRGVLVDRLIEFLRLAAVQEGEREEWVESGVGFPNVLRGLRRLKLEFEEDRGSGSTVDNGIRIDIDAGSIMNTTGNEFSFFADETTSRQTGSLPHGQGNRHSTTEETQSSRPPQPRLRVDGYPYISSHVDFMEHRDTWKRKLTKLPVWIGSGVFGPSIAVNRYMERVCCKRLRKDVGPVTPSQVAAGVPEQVLVYHAAWNGGMLDDDDGNAIWRTKQIDETPVRDVLEEIKAWRRKTKEKYDAERKRLQEEQMARRTRGGEATTAAAPGRDQGGSDSPTQEDVAGPEPVRVKLGSPHFWWTGDLQIEVNLSTT